MGSEDVGRRLDVDYVASGALRRGPDKRLTVTVQLAEARSAQVVWAEEFSGRLDDTFAVLDEIGNRIVTAIANEIEVRLPASLERDDTGIAEARKKFPDLDVIASGGVGELEVQGVPAGAYSVVLRADVFLPLEGQQPVIRTYGPYAKRLAFHKEWGSMPSRQSLIDRCCS